MFFAKFAAPEPAVSFVVPCHSQHRCQLPDSVRETNPDTLGILVDTLWGQFLQSTDAQNIATDFPRANHMFTLAPEIDPTVQALLQHLSVRSTDDKSFRHNQSIQIASPLLLDEFIRAETPTAEELGNFLVYTVWLFSK